MGSRASVRCARRPVASSSCVRCYASAPIKRSIPSAKRSSAGSCATASIEHLQDEEAALLAYEDLLSLVEDVDALRFVQAWATHHDDSKRLADTLGRLARIEQSPTERRDLWMERGRIMRTQIGDPRSALAAYEEALMVEPDFEPALDELLLCSELAGDHARQARALEHKIKLGMSHPTTRCSSSPTCTKGRSTTTRARSMRLQRWAARQPQNPVPLRRLARAVRAQPRLARAARDPRCAGELRSRAARANRSGHSCS